MLDSPLIDVAIGLSLVFLLLSMLVSSVCEMLAGFFRWRAQYLWTGLETLLQSEEARQRLYAHPLIKGLAPMRRLNLPAAVRQSVRYRVGLHVGDGPSYIPSRTFALALLDVIRQPHALAADVEARLQALVDEATTAPLALAASVARLVQQAEQDPALAACAPRLRDLQARLFQPVDASVLASLTWQIENVLLAVPTSGQGSLAPVQDWLVQAPKARNYVELRAALVDAVAAMPATQPAARECRAALEALIARFVPGSPDTIVREVRRVIEQSKDIQQALGTTSLHLQGLAGSLAPLLDDAAGDIDRFRENVESWFNDSMDRVSGAYKRNTMAWQATIGLVLAVVMNVDAIHVTRALWHDSALREVLVAQAEGVAREEQKDARADDFERLTAQVHGLGLPIGWRMCDEAAPANAGTDVRTPANLSTPLIWCSAAQGGWNWAGLLPMLLGWLLTAAAVSLGAPFWFDILKRFVSIRSAGKAPEERPTPPKEVPRPREAGERP